MNTVSKLLASLVLVGSVFAATNANAQSQPTFSFGGFSAVEVDVARLLTRPADPTGVYPYYIVLSAPFPTTGANGMTCLNPASTTNNTWAVMYSSQPDYKAMRETAQLAYALNKRIRIYADRCANLQPGTSNYIYPVIYAIETL